MIVPCSTLFRVAVQFSKQALRAYCPKMHIVYTLIYRIIEVLGLFSMSKYCRNHMHKLHSLFITLYSTKLEIYWLYFKLLHLHCG